ncbi:MAG: chemotaxis protein CheD [Candidatus Aureabacteria bacterium]|nr:chemotaxis protein CheD [Candidatus Auribacterota bacterium]
MNDEKQPQILFAGMADIVVGQASAVIKTNLGSCVAVCLYDAGKKAGGLLHCMLPKYQQFKNTSNSGKKEKYADTGIEELIKRLKTTFQTDEKNLVAKIFGGAKVLKLISKNIGDENVSSVKETLKKKNIRIVAAKTGGQKGYKIDFQLQTGTVICQVFGEKKEVF